MKEIIKNVYDKKILCSIYKKMILICCGIFNQLASKGVRGKELDMNKLAYDMVTRGSSYHMDPITKAVARGGYKAVWNFYRS